MDTSTNQPEPFFNQPEPFFIGECRFELAVVVALKRCKSFLLLAEPSIPKQPLLLAVGLSA